MARLSINEMTTYRWSFEEDVVELQAAGIPAIGVWRQKVADVGEDRAVDLLAQSGLAVSNLLWAGGFTGSDGHTFAESLQDAADAIRLAARLRAGCLVVYSGGRNSHTHNHARRLFAGALAELLPLAMELDVTLAVEPMHSACAAEWTFLTTLAEAMSLVGRNGPSAFEAGLRHLSPGARPARAGRDRPRRPAHRHRPSGRQSEAAHAANNRVNGWRAGSCRCGKSSPRCRRPATTATTTWS